MRRTTNRLFTLTFLGAFFGGSFAGCAEGASGGGGSGASSGPGASDPGGSGPGAGGGSGGTDDGGGGAGGTPPIGSCVDAEGTPVSGSNTWNDGPHQATVDVQNPDSCTRTYVLSTTGPLRDGVPSNPRSIPEQGGQPVVRTGHDMFDALYALAHEETRENSVDSISNFAFNNGSPIPCPSGGCFETGRLWTYVWTRDTAYSVALGLGLVDPTRAKNSLEFKTSLHRDGTGREIVQDTGTGGSFPISSDRVVWALGARSLLNVLDGAERAAFVDLAYAAVTNTAEHDREVVFDADDGLYRGEQSFLDWREQTYPSWTATDTVQIGMSKALGTNVGHLVLLELAAELAAEEGEPINAMKYGGWAAALRTSIRDRMWLADEGQFSSFVPGTLDPAPTRRYDLLGSALAVLEGVASSSEAASVVASYPHLAKGAPVIWPQQQDVRIYHNRAIWPFVTAFWAKAAAKTDNATAVSHAVRSLMRGSALNLSNMENFEVATGANWKDEGPMSGPVVNSQRQLWSVAGYLSMVHDVVFGLETSGAGIRFLPKLPAELRTSLFGSSSSIALSNLQYKGKRISVKLTLPDGAIGDGLLDVESVRLNGVDVGTDFVPASGLADENLFEITLGPSSSSAGTITALDESAVANYQNVFGPRTPSIDGLSIVGDRVQLALSVPETAGDVTLRVYRDGVMIADELPGGTTSFNDPGSAGHANTTYCYTVEARFLSSGNASQHSRANCWWGPGASRIQTRGAQSFTADGGNLVFNHGRWHYEGWGDAGHSITVANVVAGQSGLHYIQAVAGNGAGGYDTGITCSVKAVKVYNGATLVGSGQLVMPHLAVWSDWRESNLVPVDLVSGQSYTIVVEEDDASGNMSDFEHFSLYGGSGGTSGRFNRVNVAEVKLLAIGN
jgi:hypothetical protein